MFEYMNEDVGGRDVDQSLYSVHLYTIECLMCEVSVTPVTMVRGL